MIDQASRQIAQGRFIAAERIQGVNDNMKKPHYHEYFELYYLEAGARYQVAGETLYCLGPGDFILFPPYAMHYSYGEKDVSFKRLLLYFTNEAVKFPEIRGILAQKSLIFQAEDKKDIYSWLRMILKEQEEMAAYAEYAMLLALNQLLITLVRSMSDKPPAHSEKQNRMSQILHYLNENYTEPVTLEALAARFYINPYYLCREFKKHMGSTVIQYVNSLRILHAKRLLQETDKKVTEISKIVGFSNVTHFNRTYKSITGMSPSQTRRADHERKAVLTAQCPDF